MVLAGCLCLLVLFRPSVTQMFSSRLLRRPKGMLHEASSPFHFISFHSLEEELPPDIGTYAWRRPRPGQSGATMLRSRWQWHPPCPHASPSTAAVTPAFRMSRQSVLQAAPIVLAALGVVVRVSKEVMSVASTPVFRRTFPLHEVHIERVKLH